MKLTTLLLITAFALSAQTLEVELQRISQKALATGDYNAAIKSYKSLASRAGANRKLAAQALLAMADAYQKIGDSQSRKIYEQVLRDYADLKEETAAAQAKLGAPSTRDTRGVVLRQVWAGPGYSAHSVSPDGRSVTITYGETGDLAVRDLTTGVERRLTTTGDWYDYCDGSIYSPDGSQVAYSRLQLVRGKRKAATRRTTHRLLESSRQVHPTHRLPLRWVRQHLSLRLAP